MKRCCFQTIFQRTVKETGRSLLLDAEIDLRLRSVIVSLRTAGIKIHVVKGVLMGLVQCQTPKNLAIILTFMFLALGLDLCIKE